MTKPSQAELTALNKAVLAIKKLQKKVDSFEAKESEPIAIVGLACRFPVGPSVDAFWTSLLDGKDGVREVPESRWSKETSREFGIVPWGGFLDEVDNFDAEFFGISPREARTLDPQQRLLLEVAWEALESAGIVPASLRGSQTAVFVGISNFDYQHKFALANADVRDAHFATGNIASVSAGRLSYVLGLQGPCFALDTACSSSVVSVHAACQSLRNRESSVALAGGVNLILSEHTAASVTRTQAISPDGRCKTFDASANGYVRGEGCGMLVLKRLSDALRDGDRIRATIRGSAINHDGASAGLTVPNGLSQVAVYREALERARVSAEQVSYIETHGTGTSLGDPIEVESLKAVYGRPRPDGQRCWLGAVKSNIGHLESGAGVAGLIKAVLALEHGFIPKNLHFQRLNPMVSLTDTPFAIPTETQPWEAVGETRFAAVSSFGFSGTNGHVILSSAPSAPGTSSIPAAPAPCLVTLSGRDSAALAQQASNLHRSVGRLYEAPAHGTGAPPTARPELELPEIAFNLATTRTHFRNRLAFVVSTRDELSTELESFLKSPETSGAILSPSRRPARDRVAFVFGGEQDATVDLQATEHELYRELPTFRRAVDRCADAAPSLPGWVVVQIALFELWRACGVHPDVIVGQGLGEVAAACAAEVIALADGARLVAAPPAEFRAIAESIPHNKPRVALGGRLAERVSAKTWARPSDDTPAAELNDVLDRERATFCVRLDRREDGKRTPLASFLFGLGHAYVRGHSLDWQGLHSPGSHRRVSLPTYPFQRARHWFEPDEDELVLARQEEVPADGLLSSLLDGPDEQTAAALRARAHLDESTVKALPAVLRAIAAHREHERVRTPAGRLCYDLAWVRHEARSFDAPDAKGVWIVLMGADGVGTRIAESLETAGGTCFRIFSGPSSGGERSLSVEAGSESSVRAVFDQLIADHPAIRGLICLWGISTTTSLEARLGEGLPPDLSPALRTMQAVATSFVRQFPPLWIVTSGSTQVEPGDAVTNLEQAMLWGLGRAFEQEHPESWGGVVDMPVDADAAALDALIATLCAPPVEHYLAVRQDRVFTQRLRRHAFTEATAHPGRWSGTQLITGGTGGLGLQLAEWLARRGVPHLVLTGRRGLRGPTSQRAVSRIKELGARVTVAKVDVCDREAMARVIDGINDQGPALRGVYHLAGIADFNVLLNQTTDQFQKVLSPKVVGAWNLHELTKHLDLDAFVLYSSIASILCSAGQGAYSAANNFLDALAAARRQQGLPATSVQWGPWQGDGMSSLMNERQRLIGMPPVKADVAHGALELLLTDTASSVMVADLQWSRFRAIYEASGPKPLLADMGGAPDKPRHQAGHLLQELAGVPASRLAEAIAQWLQKETARILGWDDPLKVDLGTEYFDLGLDSLMVVELCTQIQCNLRLNVSPAVVFGHDNLELLSEHLAVLHEQRQSPGA